MAGQAASHRPSGGKWHRCAKSSLDVSWRNIEVTLKCMVRHRTARGLKLGEGQSA